MDLFGDPEDSGPGDDADDGLGGGPAPGSGTTGSVAGPGTGNGELEAGGAEEGTATGVTCRYPEFLDDASRAILPAFPAKLKGCSESAVPRFAGFVPGQPAIKIDRRICSASVVTHSKLEGYGQKAVFVWVEAAVPANAVVPGVTDELVVVKCGKMENVLTRYYKPRAGDSRFPAPEKSDRDGIRAFPNVIFLQLDAVSRAQYLRSMPKTRALLNRLRRRFRPDGRQGHQVFNMTVYHAVGERTPPNVGPMFAGLPIDDVRKLKGEGKFAMEDWSFGALRAAGYHTMFMENVCHASPGSYSNIVCPSGGDTIDQLHERFDAIGLAEYTCQLLKHMGHDSLYNGPPEICLNGAYYHRYFMRYMTEFMRANLGKPKAMVINFVEGHEGTMFRSASLDADLARWISDTLKWSEATGEVTLLAFFSDHGVVYGDFYERSSAGRQENLLPFMELVVPTTLLDRNPAWSRALAVNQHRLTTHYDVYQTVLQLLREGGGPASAAPPAALPARSHGQKTLGTSLLAPLSPARTCDDASIPNEFCQCLAWKPYEGPTAHLAMLALEHINRKTRGKPRCAQLQLQGVISAEWLEAKSADQDASQRIVRFDFLTRYGPGYSVERWRASVYVIRWRYSTVYKLDKAPLASFDALAATVSVVQRMSEAGPYEKCGDPSVVPASYCVCDLGRTGADLVHAEVPTKKLVTIGTKGEPLSEAMFERARKEPRIHVLEEHFGYEDERQAGLVAAAYMVVNPTELSACVTSDLQQMDNLDPTAVMPAVVVVGPNSTLPVVFLGRRDMKRPWAYNYTLRWSFSKDAEKSCDGKQLSPEISSTFTLLNPAGQTLRRTFSGSVFIYKIETPTHVAYEIRNLRSLDVAFTLDLSGKFEAVYNAKKFPVVITLKETDIKTFAVVKRLRSTPLSDWPGAVSWSWKWKTVD